MGRFWLACVVLVAAAVPSAAQAIRCTQAASAIERMICGDPRLLRADATMGRVYTAVLAAAPDPGIRGMLVASQKRWIAARDAQFGNLDGAINGMTGEGYPKAVQRTLVLRATDARAIDLAAPAQGAPKRLRFIQAALDQRRFAARYSGGAFAGFDTECSFLPDRGEPPSYSYVCFGTRHYQNGDRICSEREDWASWQIHTMRTVADVVGGEPRIKAACKDGGCSGAAEGWTISPATVERPRFSRALPKLDGDVSDSDTDWLQACLTDTRFPAAGGR